MLRYLMLTILACSFCGCQTLVLGEPEANNPVNNFEILWDDFDRHYGLFEARGWDWDSIYNVYQPQVTPETTDQELWTIFKEMVAYLDDSHTYVNWPGVEFFASGSERDDLTEAEFNARLAFEEYGLDTMVVDREEEYFYGRFAGRDIGYFYLGSVEMEDADAVMNGLLDQLRDRAALIVDLRNNTGGEDQTAAAIAGHFAGERQMIYTVEERNGDAQGAFGPKLEYFTEPRPNPYLKPVIVLTDQITVSAAEVLLLHLNALPQVTQMGDVTSGDFSDTGMNRFLPNGWVYQYSIMRFLLPDGTSLDGVGHVPDVFVRNTTDNIAADQDLVLERAFTYLFEEYGIE